VSRSHATLRRQDGAIVCERCVVAASAWARTKGLLGRRDLPTDEGLLIKPCSSIHMFFMRFPIDAVFVDKEMRVVRVVSDLKPWRIAWSRGSKAVIEMAAGEAARRGLQVGDSLALEEEQHDERAES
jgi:uncharacterized protein